MGDALGYIEKIIDLYNNERPHQSISYLTPNWVHRSGVITERQWKNYCPPKGKTDEIQPNLSSDAESQADSV